MDISSLTRAIILITGGKYVMIPYRGIGDRDIMSGAKLMPVYTGGSYIIVSPDLISQDSIPTSDYNTLDEERITETSTERGKKASREEQVVNLVTAFMPNVEHILLKGELDLIKERSAELGAIGAHLDSMEEQLAKLNRTLDEAFEKFDSIKARF
jgi:hypothetical protein